MPLIPGLRAELKLHQDVQSLDDEWSGITDPVVRRKLQNRLNQRAARRRKAEQKAGAGASASTASSSRAAGLKDVPLHQRIDLKSVVQLRTKQFNSSEWQAAAETFNQATQSPFVSIRSKHSCQRWYEVLLEDRLVSIKDLAEKSTTEDADQSDLYKLPADHLISLVYYNVYRALIANVHLLGLDLNLMYSDDYPSPFLPLSPSASSKIRRLPPTLEPTELQKTVAHHPMWDIFPDPEIRDNILRYGQENIDDLKLCLDMVGDGNYPGSGDLDTQQTNGLIVWGEPWDIQGWEMTECFARKWPFLIRGAINVQNSTNRWRMQRGEEPLDFGRILEIE
ncbi:hypothetical protein G647_00746 [Cladophialophora carrionii CBS 160.54]|uniref:BZIP domain-containing protein n=1 Tax=Cladophialophora carrionii CBS 160.54 TaxID=1279043 RepID=V9DQR6_9EURO|nr:uncharacterized protein G647_00746 [Cladophialophora carrionii CBS 160.54]ETI28297.1 hypothetical protein G647_00746 [Cladophialophora carrionii CBS 160.54]